MENLYKLKDTSSWTFFDAGIIFASIVLLINGAMVLRMADMAKKHNLPGVSKGVTSRILVTFGILVALSSVAIVGYIIKAVMYFTKK